MGLHRRLFHPTTEGFRPMATTPRRRSASASTDTTETAVAATSLSSSPSTEAHEGDAATATPTEAAAAAARGRKKPVTPQAGKVVKPAKKTAAKAPKPTPKPNAKPASKQAAKKVAQAVANPAVAPTVVPIVRETQVSADHAAPAAVLAALEGEGAIVQATAPELPLAQPTRAARAKTAARAAKPKPARAKAPGVKPSAKPALRAKAARAPEVPTPAEHESAVDDDPQGLSSEPPDLLPSTLTDSQVPVVPPLPLVDASRSVLEADSPAADGAVHDAEPTLHERPLPDEGGEELDDRSPESHPTHMHWDEDAVAHELVFEVATPLPLEPARQGPSRISLVDQLDGRRLLLWDLGEPCPQTVRQAVGRWLEADGALALQEPESVDELLALAMRCGHRIEVGEGVWAHLARRGDLRQRIVHLEACYPQGLDALNLPEPEAAQTLSPLPGLSPRPAQWEAACFAACAGPCLLADSPALDAPRELALAWQLVQRHFGARRLVVQVSAAHLEARQTEWLARLATVPGLEGAQVAVQSIDAPLPHEGVDVLIVDQRDGWLPAPPASASRDANAPWTWAWVLAHPDTVLEDTVAAEGWLAWLDRLGLGVVAQGLAQADRKVLTTLLLARDWEEVAEQWPAWNPQTLIAPWTTESAAEHAQATAVARAGLSRWRASGFLSDTDQLALQAALQRDAQAEREAALAQLPALLARADAEGVHRVVIFAEAVAEPALPGWAQALAGEGRSVQVLPMAYRDAEAVVRGFRDGEGLQVLLAPDGVPGMEPRIPCTPHRPWIIHLDRPWDLSLSERRLQRLRLPRGERAVPVWQLLVEGGLSARRQASASGAAGALPVAAPASATGWTSRLRRGAELQAWLTELATCVFEPATGTFGLPGHGGAVLDAGTPVPSQGDDTPSTLA